MVFYLNILQCRPNSTIITIGHIQKSRNMLPSMTLQQYGFVTLKMCQWYFHDILDMQLVFFEVPWYMDFSAMIYFKVL